MTSFKATHRLYNFTKNETYDVVFVNHSRQDKQNWMQLVDENYQCRGYWHKLRNTFVIPDCTNYRIQDLEYAKSLEAKRKY